VYIGISYNSPLSTVAVSSDWAQYPKFSRGPFASNLYKTRTLIHSTPTLKVDVVYASETSVTLSTFIRRRDRKAELL
jgi:hypothetical protein